MKTKVIRINPRNPERRKIREAAGVIRRGGLVVFPTETVYGIGADAYNRRATAKVYEVKGRPLKNPLMVHVSDMEMAKRVGVFPKRYYRIIERLWPGPIAFVVKARKGLGRKEVAIRMPSNRVALELIRASGTPIAAPSANLSKKPSATKAGHALGYFEGKVDVIIDSGQAQKGIESTILDLRSFQLHRPGSFPIEKLTSAFGRKPIITDAARGLNDARKAIAPGMKYRHYSPDTPLFLYVGAQGRLPRILSGINSDFVFIGSDRTCRSLGCRKIRLGSGVDDVARNLFDALIRLDGMNARFAVIEQFPEKGMGLGLMNRIRKASDHKQFSDRRGLDLLLSGL